MRPRAVRRPRGDVPTPGVPRIRARRSRPPTSAPSSTSPSQRAGRCGRDCVQFGLSRLVISEKILTCVSHIGGARAGEMSARVSLSPPSAALWRCRDRARVQPTASTSPRCAPRTGGIQPRRSGEDDERVRLPNSTSTRGRDATFQRTPSPGTAPRTAPRPRGDPRASDLSATGTVSACRTRIGWTHSPSCSPTRWLRRADA